MNDVRNSFPFYPSAHHRRIMASVITVVAAISLGSGCTSKSAPGSDTTPPGSDVCCPIEGGGCDCFGIGGTKKNNSCPTLCDAPPGSLMSSVDENGCPVLVHNPNFSGGSCLPSGQGDGGPEVTANDDLASDRAGDADGDGASDSGTDAVVCCPIEGGSCDCFGIGGTKKNNRCPTLCDAPFGSLMSSVDENGCPVLVHNPNFSGGGCLSPPDAGPDVTASTDVGTER